MIIPNWLQAFYRRISLKGEDSDRIYNAMMQATKSSFESVHARKVCDLLVTLKKYKVGTNDVEYGVRRSCQLLSEKRKSLIKMEIMRKKIGDAFCVMMKKRRDSARIWKEIKKIIVGNVRVEYLNKWREGMLKLKEKLMVSNSKKVEWLKKKWKITSKDSMDISKLRGINIEDVLLENEFDSGPRVYGDVTLSEQEIVVLNLPPKYGVYKKVDPTQCKIDVEESLNKLRWNRVIAKNKDKEQNENVIGEKFVDKVTGIVDIQKLQPRDLPFNHHVAMPPALTIEEEMKIFQLKTEIAKITQDMTNQSVKWSNLSEPEKEGLESLVQRVKDKEVVCTVTDKSGRWSCDTIDNYKIGCMKLVDDAKKTPKITVDQHDGAEREMNCHALALTRMLGLGDGISGNRLRSTVIAEGCNIAPLYGLRKDHKPMGNSEEELSRGPKMRPVCGARDSLTKRTSYLLCQILTPLIEGDTHCDATDGIRAEVSKVNNGNVKRDWVVGSLDVDSLYPSLDIDRCVSVVKNKLKESKMDFKNLQWKEVALYLKFNMLDEEAQRSTFLEYLPKRRYRRRPPIFVRSGSMNDAKIRHQPWIYPQQSPDNAVVREMFCEAVAIMIKKTSSLHDYQVDGDIYRQSEGGSIGMDLTGVIADIYMLEWDRKLISAIEERAIGIKIYKRYKDDINLLLDVENSDLPIDGRSEEGTMEEVKRLANDIDPALNVTVDYSSNHDDGRLPVLDLKLWIGENVEGVMKVMYSHYTKDVSSRATIHYRSSHSMIMKKNVMVNEIGRILLNCSKEIPWDETAGHVAYFVKRMQFSGYPMEFRYEVVTEALRRYDRVNGERSPTNVKRCKPTQRNEYQWYSKNGKYESVMFVEATPESELKRKVQQIISRLKMKIKVVERTGTTVKGLLQKSNPFGIGDCGRDKCLICCQGCGSNCRERGCVYEYICEECERKYRGQTGRSIYERNKEHIESWEKGEDDCPLQRHANLYHGGGNFVAELKIIAKCYGKPSRRLITEAVMIDELLETQAMNGKNEWSYVKLAKVQVHGQNDG